MTRIAHMTITACPICASSDLIPVFDVKDHTVSKESFPISKCNNCTLRFTQNAPGENEIGRYYKSEDYISHSNTSKGMINNLYQSVRKRTLKKKRKLIESITGVEKGRLLDIGSGTGAFVNEMKQHGWDCTGLEPDSDARKVAKIQNELELGDMSEFPKLPAKNYHAITLWHVLEHVHALDPYLQQLSKLLIDSGRLFIAVPNYTSMDASIYKEFWAAYDVPRHLWHFSPASMKELLEKNGFSIEKYKPMWYDSFYISMLSSKYKNGKTNLVSSFLNGLRSNINALGNVKKCSSVIYVVRKK
jgi:2-polyprenyl-3-methyl-5-hydroxy-6-metoxy-1,4-benzoquinol methylase